MFDVITILETWNDPTTMEPYNIPTYNVFHVCRENAKGGGVAIYVNVTGSFGTWYNSQHQVDSV